MAPSSTVAALVVAALSAVAAASRPALAGGDDPRRGEPMPAELAGEGDAGFGRRLQQSLRLHGGDVYGCYDRAQGASDHPLAGELLVRLWVGPAPAGAVERAEVLKDQLDSAALSACLLAAMRGWRVPELAGAETQQVVFPLVFRGDPADRPGERGAAAAARPGPRRHVVPLAEGKPGPLGESGRVEARVLIDALTTGGPTQATLTHLVLAPTARLSPHSHPGVVELLYVVRGLARVRGARGSDLVTASAGDVIVVPPSGLHSVESAPLAPLTLLQIFAPGGPEHAYRDPTDRGGTRPARPGEKQTDMPVVVHGGEPLPLAGGHGRVQLFLDGLPLGQASLQRLELDAGAELPPSVSDRADQLLYVLSGRATLLVDGAAQPIGEGDAAHVPVGALVSLRAGERLLLLSCHAPGGPEQRYKKPPASK